MCITVWLCLEMTRTVLKPWHCIEIQFFAGEHSYRDASLPTFVAVIQLHLRIPPAYGEYYTFLLSVLLGII